MKWSIEVPSWFPHFTIDISAALLAVLATYGLCWGCRVLWGAWKELGGDE